jgi:hypothetical protein
MSVNKVTLQESIRNLEKRLEEQKAAGLKKLKAIPRTEQLLKIFKQRLKEKEKT